jgi:hypothetical protein
MNRIPDVAQDLRGWFAAIAPDCLLGSRSRRNPRRKLVYQRHPHGIGAIRRSVRKNMNFDIVVIHQSLGGCTTRSALVSARRLLRQGGWLVLSGANRLRPQARGDGRRSGQSYRLGIPVGAAGFADISLHVAHPPDCAPSP